MGLAPGWRVAVRYRARDEALGRLAEHFGAGTALSLAIKIYAAVDRYYTAGWRADHRTGRRPNDQLRGMCFDLLLHTRPLSVRTIRDLIGKGAIRVCQPTGAPSAHGPRTTYPQHDQQRQRDAPEPIARIKPLADDPEHRRLTELLRELRAGLAVRRMREEISAIDGALRSVTLSQRGEQATRLSERRETLLAALPKLRSVDN